MEKQELKVQQELGAKIKRMIKANDTTVYAISKKTGLSIPIINSVIEGNKRYTFVTLIKILNNINCKLELTKKPC